MFKKIDNGQLLSYGSQGGNGSLGRDQKEEESIDLVGGPFSMSEKVINAVSLYYGAVMSCYTEDSPTKLFGFGYNSNG